MMIRINDSLYRITSVDHLTDTCTITDAKNTLANSVVSYSSLKRMINEGTATVE